MRGESKVLILRKGPYKVGVLRYYFINMKVLGRILPTLWMVTITLLLASIIYVIPGGPSEEERQGTFYFFIILYIMSCIATVVYLYKKLTVKIQR